MTWFAQSTNETEAAKEHVLLFVAVDFNFSSGHLRLWSGTGDLSISGNTYTGVGDLGKISTPDERSSLAIDKKTYQLSGVDPALVSEADIDASFARSVTEYFGFLDPQTYALVATPEINWEGEISSIRRVDGKEPIIEVNAENRLAMIEQADGWRYTHEHQKQFYTGDLGFDQISKMETKDVMWGGTGGGGGGGGGGGPGVKPPRHEY